MTKPRKYVRRGKRYGLRPDAKVQRDHASGILGNPQIPIHYNAEWVYHSVPSDSQGDLGACVGYAWAGWVECMLRKHLGRDVLKPGEQIDGEAIWRKARRMFYRDEPEEAGGLLLEEGYSALEMMGIIPPGSFLMRPANGAAALSIALKGCPLVIAQALHDGWNTPRTDNGWIEQQPGDRNQGHAILMVGVTQQAGLPFYLIHNSWGIDWGWRGLCVISESHYQRNTLSNAAYAVLPLGWTQHEGWRKWVKVRPETAR